MHYACGKNIQDMVEFLIEEEKKRIQTDRDQGKEGGTPSYNMMDIRGWQPVFWTTSSRIVEMLLRFGDLEVTSGDGEPLLWRCAWKGSASEMVAERLRGQIGQRWKDTLPFDRGEHVNLH